MRIGTVLLGLLVTVILALAALTASPGAIAFDPTHQRGDDHRRISGAPLRDRSLLIEGNTIRDCFPRTPRAGGGTSARSQRKIHYSRIVRFPCALARMDGRALRQPRSDFRHRAGERTQGAARKKPGRRRSSALLSQRRPADIHQSSSEADIRQAVRNWLLNEPDLAWFPQYNDRIARAYAIAADEAHKAGFLVFGHTDNAPGSLRDGIDIFEHIWGFGEAVMSPEQLRSFQEGQFADLGDVHDRLEQAGWNDRGCGSAWRLSQSDAALRMGWHEQARPAARV